MEDGNFEASSGLWSTTNTSSGDVIQGASNKYYRLSGSTTADKWVWQRIPVGRSASTTFFAISGMTWADSVALSNGRYCGIGLRAHFTDGTEDTKRVSFNADYSASTVGFSGNKTIEYVDAFFSYGKNANSVYFDNLQVNLDASGMTYTYDKSGNLISARDNAGRNQKFSYNNAKEITKINTADNKSYTYEYDSTNKHQLTGATSTSSGIKISLTYDEYGNVTSTRVRKGSGHYI